VPPARPFSPAKTLPRRRPTAGREPPGEEEVRDGVELGDAVKKALRSYAVAAADDINAL